MIRNYIKIALRNIWKSKTYSFLNLFGLAIGITCASLIFLWAEDEVNYNSEFAGKNSIYRIIENQQYEGEWRTFTSTPGPMAKAITEEIPGIEYASRVRNRKLLFSLNEKRIIEKGVYADPSFFTIFDLDFLQGNPENAFNQVNSIVISEKMAKQFFGNQKNIIGKTIKLDNKENYTITGVIKDFPDNVTLKFDWISAFEPYAKSRAWLQDWDNNSVDTYIKVAEKANVAAIDTKIRSFLEEKTGDPGTSAFLFSMNDWHLRSQFESGKQTGGRILYVRLFMIIACIILSIACINFMNLATARSEKRANEVGVRKVLGAVRNRLITQFITEAILMASLAVLLSVLLTISVLPAFNVLVEKQLSIGFGNPIHLSALLLITLICGLFAGCYPALYLSSFKPIAVLKGIKSKQGSASLIRKGLVIAQFTASIALIISTLVVYQQIQHVKNRELGYEKERLITMNVRGDMIKNFNRIKQDMLKTGTIENVALNSYETLSVGNNGSGMTWKGKDESNDLLISYRFISPEFISTAGMEIINGRDFQIGSPADTTNIIITQSLAKIMGEETVIGKNVQWGDSQLKVMGVVKDFLYGDMYTSSDPVVFFNDPEEARYMYVKLSANGNTASTLGKIKAVMQKNNPAYPFEYSFVDDDFNAKFKSENLVSKLSRIFAVLAILISCLGLFGLAAYTAEQRNKEIGVRKVLGASVSRIVRLLSKDFLKLVLIAIVIAIPLAWFVMKNWLDGFAYRININWWVFIVAGLTAVMIALFTVSFQTIKAAIANPIKSLRTE
ncbi:ABC transporter permease [Aquimarina sp. 2201CG5-10]|uniref:ABC transporter permease n=1 Tax=Aquimarina callyspongiae TaxID=3098150 RepID=UPI002AB34EC3|nr:ABC transporter permease [Aquimarina sp. 2201CG5-10]MDY8137524.1 ABC transporter permease [Aquimarina sp. 2201CG5-10]